MKERDHRDLASVSLAVIAIVLALAAIAIELGVQLGYLGD
jgi:hypothetical protein